MTASLVVLYDVPADPAAFDDHYQTVHVPLTQALPGLRSYTLAKQPRPLRGAPVWQIATMTWATMADLEAAFASAAGQGAAADMANLTRLTTVHSHICLDERQPTDPVSGGANSADRGGANPA